MQTEWRTQRSTYLITVRFTNYNAVYSMAGIHVSGSTSGTSTWKDCYINWLRVSTRYNLRLKIKYNSLDT